MYLRDHHLYNDDRFEIALRVHREFDDVRIAVAPGKYSWHKLACRTGDLNESSESLSFASDPHSVAQSGPSLHV
jgi:hypothetical protein